jgi:hypothetical protein
VLTAVDARGERVSVPVEYACEIELITASKRGYHVFGGH